MNNEPALNDDNGKWSLLGENAAAPGKTKRIKVGSTGSLQTSEALAPVYEDNVAGVARVEQRYTPLAVNAAGTNVIKSGSGFIHQIRVIGGTLGAVTIYDNTAGSGTVIVPTVTPTAAGTLIEDVTFNNGLTIVTAAATIITGSYR